MVIVAGYLMVDPKRRDDYLAGCVDVVQQARHVPGCLDFALSADVLIRGASTSSNAGSHSPRSRHFVAAAPATSKARRSCRHR